MKIRIISGLLMLPLLIFVGLGGPFLMAAVFVIATVGIWEFFKGFRAADVKPSFAAAAVSLVLLYILNILVHYVRAVPPHMVTPLYTFWFTLSVFISFLYMFKIEKRKLTDGMATVVGIIYIGFFSFHAVLTDQVFSPYTGVSMVWLILFSAFCTDTGAYFGGSLVGKHRLCPEISPKKTVEGSIIGILSSALVCSVFGLLLLPVDKAAGCIIAGVLGGVVSQLGDLTASVFKRKMGIKDFGNLIPGHGGVMDRFDSVLFTAPMVYYIMLVFYMHELSTDTASLM